MKSANYSIEYNMFTFIVEDESFKKIKPGDVIPELKVVFSKFTA